MPYITKQGRPSDLSETDLCGLAARDRPLDRLIAQLDRASDAGVSASLLGLTVTYEGKVLDPARVVLHRNFGRTAPPGGSAPRRSSDRPALPGEFLG